MPVEDYNRIWPQLTFQRQPEPTTAGYADGAETEKHDGRMILVYDVGGGAVDVCICLINERDFLLLELDGDIQLGGDDMDNAIIDILINYIKNNYRKNARQNKAAMVEIKMLAEMVKKDLSSMDVMEVEINTTLRTMDNINVEMTITKEQYEAAIRPLVERSMELVDRAIVKSGVPEEQIEEVLVVGGATRTPWVQQMLIDRFGNDRVQFDIDPVEYFGKDVTRVWKAFTKACHIIEPSSRQAFIRDIRLLVPRLERGAYAAEIELDEISSRINQELAHQPGNKGGMVPQGGDGVTNQNQIDPFLS